VSNLPIFRLDIFHFVTILWKIPIAMIAIAVGEGYKLNDFKKVIDLKVKDLLNDAHWHKYLRPSTLFNATNFENYLEETRDVKSADKSSHKPIELDFSKGED